MSDAGPFVIPEIRRFTLSAPGGIWMVSPSLDPEVTPKDCSPGDLAGAFFKDSIRRDAIIGVKIVYALWKAG